MPRAFLLFLSCSPLGPMFTLVTHRQLLRLVSPLLQLAGHSVLPPSAAEEWAGWFHVTLLGLCSFRG